MIFMRKLHAYFFGALLLSTAAACTKSIDPNAEAEAVYQSNLADIKTYATSKGLSGTSTSSGLYYLLTKPGTTSVSTAIGQEAELNYTVYALTRSAGSTAVITEKKVDSTYTTTSAFGPITNTNAGLIEALLRMHEGDQATLLMPYVLSFNVDYGNIPVNSPVRIDVALKRARTEQQQIEEYLTANKLTPTQVTTSSLYFIKTLDNPTGISPTPTQTLNVRYKGKLLRAASAFDSTGTGTAPFTLGQTVPGFNEALTKLKVGEKATIIFPSTLGYGADGRRTIPPYAPLRFDIELVSVQ